MHDVQLCRSHRAGVAVQQHPFRRRPDPWHAEAADGPAVQPHLTEEEKDPDLFEGIWAKELPGVLNQALRGYKRLLERGTKFKTPKDVRRATTHWLQQANPLPAFLQAHCIAKPQGRCLVKDFYAHYSAWTRDMGYTLTQTQQTVTRNLAYLGYGTKKTNQGMAIIGLVLAHGRDD
jgi:phage/plasmid-associated DNA primase